MRKKKETYYWLPAGDENLASSRLRCYYIHRELIKNGVLSYIGGLKFCSTNIIQKRLDLKAILIVIFSKIFNLKVVLDIDDVKSNDKKWEQRISLFANIVDVISTATIEQQLIIKKHLTDLQISNLSFFVFENPIDYEIKNGLNKISFENKKEFNIGWFGNSGNFDLYNEFKILDNLGYNTVIISDNNPLNKCEIKNLKFIKWNRFDFEQQLLRNIDICILSHFGNEISESKSGNKLIASIAIGVPVIASKTPAYTRIAKEFGIENFLFNNEEDLSRIINNLTNPEVRIEYLKIRNSLVFKKYSIENIKKNFNDYFLNIEKRNSKKFSSICKAIYFLIKIKYFE